MNGTCVKNNTHIYVAQTSNNTVIMAFDLYCCLLPQGDALCIYCSGFPIATMGLGVVSEILSIAGHPKYQKTDPSRSSKVSKDSNCSLISSKNFSEILPTNS